MGISEIFFLRAQSNCVRRWLRMQRENPILWLFLKTRDEGSFDGFEGRRSNNDSDSDSDVDLEDLEYDNGSPAPGGTDDEEEEA